MTEESLTTAELAGLEEAVGRALAAGDPSLLTVLGFGELSVALGWPTDQPRLVCKRLPPFTVAQLTRYEQVMAHYLEELSVRGVGVVDTSLMSLERNDGRRTAYLVQSLMPSESLGHNVLAAAAPDPDHPFLGALASTLEAVSVRLSVDAQVTNFSWDGTSVTLLDVGTPLVWDGSGAFQFDMTPFLVMVPAPRLKALQRVERAWQTRVRRRPYEFFIHSTFGGGQTY
ncbi:MAG: hypothetical protein GY929_20510 [Actinomycetia bacterium]|nr:hypothetical protein [Actinomycetes bacterium]